MLKLKTAFRYAYSKSSGQKSLAVMITVSIALGVFALILVLSIMNGLQSAQLDNLRAIESFDLIVENTSLTKAQLEEITNSTVYAFKDSTGLISGPEQSSTVRIRSVESSYFKDLRLTGKVAVNGEIQNGLILSYPIVSSTGYKPGDIVELTILKKGKTATLAPQVETYYPIGIFVTNLRDFNTSSVYLAEDAANPSYGIFTDSNTGQLKKAILDNDGNAQVITWQEYNNSIYSALMLEKTMVYVLLAFIFIIICVSLGNSTKHLFRAKQNETAAFKALGFNNSDLTVIYILQALFITVPGEAIGTLAAVLTVNNIDSILNLIGSISTALTGHVSVLNLLPFSTFISTTEVFGIVTGVLLLALVFTLFSVKSFKKYSVIEVINHGSN